MCHELASQLLLSNGIAFTTDIKASAIASDTFLNCSLTNIITLSLLPELVLEK